MKTPNSDFYATTVTNRPQVNWIAQIWILASHLQRNGHKMSIWVSLRKVVFSYWLYLSLLERRNRSDLEIRLQSQVTRRERKCCSFCNCWKTTESVNMTRQNLIFYWWSSRRPAEGRIWQFPTPTFYWWSRIFNRVTNGPTSPANRHDWPEIWAPTAPIRRIWKWVRLEVTTLICGSFPVATCQTTKFLRLLLSYLHPFTLPLHLPNSNKLNLAQPRMGIGSPGGVSVQLTCPQIIQITRMTIRRISSPRWSPFLKSGCTIWATWLFNRFVSRRPARGTVSSILEWWAKRHLSNARWGLRKAP